jgi:hypothetical protein
LGANTGRAARWRRATRRPRRNNEAVTCPRSGTVTVPRLTTGTTMNRKPRLRWTRTPPSARRRTTLPGIRTLTRSPSLSRRETRLPCWGRVVSRTSTWWSPGSASRPALARSVRTALLPGPTSKRSGEIWSHLLATVRRRTSTTTCSAPSFRTLILLDPGAASASRAGETERATRGRSALTASAAEAVSKNPAKTASPRAPFNERPP